MTTLFAQSYASAHIGFYFENLTEYCELIDSLQARGYEEFEIQFIDGEPEQAALFESVGISQASIQFWFEHLDHLDEKEALQLTFLLNCGYELTDALQRYNDVSLYFGGSSDYAQDFIEDTSDIPSHLANYIDYDAIARDMEINGEITEVAHDTYVTNALEF